MLLRRLTATGFRRGLSGSRGWLIVGVTAGGLRALRRLAHDEPEVIYRTQVQPGDHIVIETRDAQ